MARGILAVVVVGFLFCAAPAGATDIDIGPMRVINDLDVAVQVTVYHADDIDEVFQSFLIEAGNTHQFEADGNPCTIGGDWLIRVQPIGKEPSKRRLLWKVSEFKDGMFTVRAGVAYEGK